VRRFFSKDIGPHDEIGDVSLVLERDEHDALGRARLLADEHQPGEFDQRPSFVVRSSPHVIIRAL
jgi:hypothetical protein